MKIIGLIDDVAWPPTSALLGNDDFGAQVVVGDAVEDDLVALPVPDAGDGQLTGVPGSYCVATTTAKGATASRSFFIGATRHISVKAALGHWDPRLV